MSTFRLRRFAHPESLKTIAPKRLLAFLRPYSDYFARRGVELPEEAEVMNYEGLVAILINPDEDVPTEMVEALYFVHEMADESVMEQVIDEAEQHNIDLQLDEGPTAADAAIALWLACPDLLRKVHAESFVVHQRRFEYYSGGARRQREFPDYVPQKLTEIAATLDIWFSHKKRGDGSMVVIVKRGKKVFVSVRHGTSMWREGSLHKGKRGTAYYRPEVHDVLVYDTTIDQLGVKAGTQGEKNLYRSTFGRMLFGDEAYFGKPFELTLDPVREEGPKVLECADVDGLQSVRLVEFRRWFGGEYKESDVRKATDLFRSMGDRWQTLLRAGKLLSAIDLPLKFHPQPLEPRPVLRRSAR